MRALLPIAVLVVLALAQPTGAAAGVEVLVGKRLEGALIPGGSVEFEVPLRVTNDGALYAKLLPTSGNAVNDGRAANGTVDPAGGWRVSFALRRNATSERVDLGTFVDSAPTERVEMRAGDELTLFVIVHTPADALRGGATQNVHVAVVYRLDGASGSGSGGVMDDSRAITLILSDPDLAPSTADADVPPAVEPPPVSPPPDSPPPVSPLPVDTAPRGDLAPAPLATASLPTWFLVGALAIGAALVVVLALLVRAVHQILGVIAPDAAAARSRTIPVRSSEGPTEVAAEEKQQ